MVGKLLVRFDGLVHQVQLQSGFGSRTANLHRGAIASAVKRFELGAVAERIKRPWRFVWSNVEV